MRRLRHLAPLLLLLLTACASLGPYADGSGAVWRDGAWYVDGDDGRGDYYYAPAQVEYRYYERYAYPSAFGFWRLDRYGCGWYGDCWRYGYYGGWPGYGSHLPYSGWSFVLAPAWHYGSWGWSLGYGGWRPWGYPDYRHAPPRRHGDRRDEERRREHRRYEGRPRPPAATPVEPPVHAQPPAPPPRWRGGYEPGREPRPMPRPIEPARPLPEQMPPLPRRGASPHWPRDEAGDPAPGSRPPRREMAAPVERPPVWREPQRSRPMPPATAPRLPPARAGESDGERGSSRREPEVEP